MINEMTDEFYETIRYLIPKVYQECVQNGYTLAGAAGKTESEMDPMARTTVDKNLLWIEYCFFYAQKNLREVFNIMYNKNSNNTNTEELRQHVERISSLSEASKKEIRDKIAFIDQYNNQN